MKQIKQIETTARQLRERAEDDLDVDLEVLAGKLEEVARYAKDCRDRRVAAEEQTEEMRGLLEEKYRDGYRSALAAIRAQADALEGSVD